MKRLFLIATFVALCATSKSQVFETAQTLSPKQFSLGVLPTHTEGNLDEIIYFLQGECGLKQGIDLGLTMGSDFANVNYLGADIEWAFRENLSVSAGMHKYGDWGCDLTGLYTFNIIDKVHLTTGLDFDYYFIAHKSNRLQTWLPINIELNLRENLFLTTELRVGDEDITNLIQLTNSMDTYLTLGVQYHF